MSDAGNDDLLAAIDADLQRQRTGAKAAKRKKHAERERASRQVAPELHRAAQQRYRERHPEKDAEQHRKQRDRVKADPELLARHRARRAAWKKAHPEQHKEHNRRYAARKRARQVAEALSERTEGEAGPAVDAGDRADVEADLARIVRAGTKQTAKGAPRGPRKHTAAQRAQHAARERARRAAYPERFREIQRRYDAKRQQKIASGELTSAYQRMTPERRRKSEESRNLWRARNPEKVREYKARSYAKRRNAANAGREKAQGPVLSWRVMQDQLYAACASAVPKSIDPSVREDVVADMIVAVLEGNIQQDELHLHGKRFLRAYDFRFNERSLDAPIPGTEGKVTYLDRLAAPEPVEWLEAAE